MRTLFLALFVGLALAEVDEGAFEHGRRYIFRYEAQLVVGSPESSQLWSGLKLTANLTLSFESDVRVTAQLMGTNLQKMDKFLPEETPNFFMLPEDELLDGVEADVPSGMLSQLEKPFSFIWEHGHVMDIGILTSEPLWSVNIKKGIISLFLVNLDGLFSIDPIPNKGEEMDRPMPSYTVLEMSPIGVCLTTYTPVLSTEEGFFYLTKVRDYSSCYQKPSMVYSFNNFRPQGNSSTMEHLNMQAEVSYAIKGNKKDFIILTAVGVGKIVFVPYGRQDGSVQASINQTLYLLDAENIKIPPKFVDPLPDHEVTLEMDMPIENVQNLEPYVLKKQPPTPIYHTPFWSVGKMEQLLTWVVSATAEYPSEDVLTMSQTLMEMIRQSNHHKLEKMMKDIQENSTQDPLGSLKLSMYFDLLSIAGTTEASRVVLENCLMKVLSKNDSLYTTCILAITAIGLYSPPSERTISELLVLEDYELRRHDYELRSVVLLALSSVFGRAEDMYQDIMNTGIGKIKIIDHILEIETGGTYEELLKKQKRKVEHRLEKIRTRHTEIEAKIAQIIKHIMHTGLDENIILGLKALRNAHIPSTISLIERYLISETSSAPVRVMAAQAYEKFDTEKTMVLKILQQVLKNPDEIASVRIQCFRSMINLEAPVNMLVQLATAISYEKAKQLSTYVWSTFNTMANSTFRPYRMAAEEFRAALPHIQPVESGFQDAQYRQQQLDLAQDLSIMQESSYVSDLQFVTNLDFATAADMFGTASKGFQMTIQTQGILKAIKKLFGPKGFLTNRNSVFDLLKRTKRSTDTKDKIKEIFQLLDVHARNISDTTAYIDIQLLNNIVRLWSLKDLLKGIVDGPFIHADINEEKIKEGVKIDFKHSGSFNQFFLELATEAGFPINLQMGLNYALKVTGSASAAVETSIYKNTREGNPPTQVKTKLFLMPKLVCSLVGKMSVDGFLFQAGTLAHALVHIQGPVSLNTTVDLLKNRLLIEFAPPVDAKTPAVKLEMKPYVFSRAVANKTRFSPGPTAKVNTRPVFFTMQPVISSNGAKIKQFDTTLTRPALGYQLNIQGQHQWAALPYSTSYPMLGRSVIALYVKSDQEIPPKLTADLRYISKPHYKTVLDESGEKRRVPVCWSWIPWLCSGLDDDDLVEQTSAESQPTPPIGDIPDLSSTISVEAVKDSIERKMGSKFPDMPLPPEKALVGIFNGTSSLVVKLLLISGNEGQIQQSLLHMWLKPVKDLVKEWMLAAITSTVYPSKRATVKDLLDPIRQADTQSQLITSMEHKEHRVINMYFQRLLSTLMNNYAIQRLPSMDPELMLDRIFPEYILQHTTEYTSIRTTRNILKTLLPLTEQLIELKSEMEDAFVISFKNNLIFEILDKILTLQNEIEDLLLKLQEEEMRKVEVIACVEYTILKASQSVMLFREIAKRAISLMMVEKPRMLATGVAGMDKRQREIYKLSAVVLAPPPTNASSKPVTDSIEDYHIASVIGYSVNELPSSAETMMPVSSILQSLQALSAEQLKKIRDIWAELIEGRPIAHAFISPLIKDTACNVTMINDHIKEENPDINDTLPILIMQTTVQHQIIVYMLQTAPYSSSVEIVNNFDRYSLKVQTKELLERGMILQHQMKLDKICRPGLTEMESSILTELEVIDRKLVALQQDHIRLPTNEYPWTTNTENLGLAHTTMNSILKKLESVRGRILPESSMSHPCLLAKLLDTVITLQQRVAIFKRTLLAQYNNETQQLTDDYEMLDDSTKDYILSLTPIFDKYVTATHNKQPDIFPIGNILATEGMVEVSRILNTQDQLIRNMNVVLYQPNAPPFFLEKTVLESTMQNSKELLRQLQEEALRVQRIMQTTSKPSARAVFTGYVNSLKKQQSIYDTLTQQMKLYAAEPDLPDMLEEIEMDRSTVGDLINKAGEFKLPSPPPTNSEPISVEVSTTHEPVLDGSSLADEVVYNDFSWPEISEEAVSGEDQSTNPRRTTSSCKDIDITPTSGPINPAPPPDPVLPYDYDGVTFVAHIIYGNAKEIVIRVHAMKTYEQMLWEMMQFYPQSRDYCVSHAVESLITGREMMETCSQEIELRMNSYNHVHMLMATGTDQMPKLLENGMKKVMDYMMIKHYDKADFMDPDPVVRPGTVQVMLDFSTVMDSVNHYYLTETETMALRSLSLPTCVKGLYPMQNLAPVRTVALQELTANLVPSICKVHRGNVLTNDRYVFDSHFRHKCPRNTEHPAKPCPMHTVLAMDCSMDMAFALIITQSSPYTGEVLQILAEDHEVVVKPRIISKEVIVDGVEIKLEYGKPIIFVKEVAYGTEVVVLKLSLTLTDAIHVEYPMVGLDILYHLLDITIDMSAVYSKQLCGLCGNFDGQMTKELEGPQRQVYTAARDFIKSYDLPHPL